MNNKTIDFLIIAGGQVPPAFFIRKLLAKSKKVVSVDRGAQTCLKLKVRPWLHVGDFDSINKSIVKKLRPQTLISLSQDKSLSDLEFTLQNLPDTSKKIVLGAHRDHEGRTDHLFINLMLLENFNNTIYADEKTFIYPVKPKKMATFSLPIKTEFSLVTTPHNKIQIKGAKYAIPKNGRLKNLSQGLSNQTKGKSLSIRTSKSALLFINASILRCGNSLN